MISELTATSTHTNYYTEALCLENWNLNYLASNKKQIQYMMTYETWCKIMVGFVWQDNKHIFTKTWYLIILREETP